MLPGIFYGSFTSAWFCNIMHWSFGKYWSTQFFKCSKYLQWFILQYKKITFFCYIISQLISSDSIDIKNLSNSSGRLRFSILFFARKLSCYHLQQKLSFVFLEVVGSLHSFFSGKYLPNTHILITIIYVSVFFFLSKNGVPWREKAYVLFFEAEVLSGCFDLVTQQMKKTWVQGSRFNKTSNFSVP